MKENRFWFFVIILLTLFTGCSTPKQVSHRPVDDGGVHFLSQEPEQRKLLYAKRIRNEHLRILQDRNLGYEEAEVAIEQLGNIKEYAAKNGVTVEELKSILAEIKNRQEERKRSSVYPQGYYSGGAYGAPVYVNGAIYPTGYPGYPYTIVRTHSFGGIIGGGGSFSSGGAIYPTGR